MTFTPVTTVPTGIFRATVKQTLHRFIKCWRITRTDGTILRFTEAAQSLSVLALDVPETFDPMEGMSTSAEQLKNGLNEQNFEATGVLSDARITHDDLRAGLYADAQIDVLLVDWEAPELGPMTSRSYWIEKIQFNGVEWKADITGLPGWLKRNEGDLYVSTCQHDLGDARCKVDLALFTETATVSAVSDQRKDFTSSVSVQADNFFQFGKITWTSGLNAGIVSEVASSLMSGGALVLRLPTPFDIAATDIFSIHPGCQKRLSEDCVAKFDNLPNNGGFPFIPGTDKLLEVPGQK
jgi:uncharacterized phage protein (TIGR02218 family)